MAGPMVDGGLGRRAGLGAKLALKRMNALNAPERSRNAITTTSAAINLKSRKGKEIAASSSDALESHVSPPKNAKDIDAIITQELIVAYSRGR